MLRTSTTERTRRPGVHTSESSARGAFAQPAGLTRRAGVAHHHTQVVARMAESAQFNRIDVFKYDLVMVACCVLARASAANYGTRIRSRRFARARPRAGPRGGSNLGISSLVPGNGRFPEMFRRNHRLPTENSGLTSLFEELTDLKLALTTLNPDPVTRTYCKYNSY
eukprot:COSAG02_NODE_3040_length_7491_cov_7.889205_5_plen_167_part_00